MPRGGKRPGAGRKPRKRARLAPFEIVEGGAGVPPEPDWSIIYSDELDIELARVQWRSIINELRDTEKLAAVNGHQIMRCVVAYVLYEKALRDVAENGAVTKRSGKKQPAYNPHFTVLKDAHAMASAAEAELTISPRRRNNGGKVQRKKPSQVGGGYLKSLPK